MLQVKNDNLDLFNNLPYLSIITKPHGEIVEMNQTAVELLSKKVKIGTNILSIYSKTQAKNIKKILETIKDSESIKEVVPMILGKKHVFLENNIKQLDFNNHHNYILFILKDITEYIEKENCCQFEVDISRAILINEKTEDVVSNILNIFLKNVKWHIGTAWLMDINKNLEYLCGVYPKEYRYTDFIKQTIVNNPSTLLFPHKIATVRKPRWVSNFGNSGNTRAKAAKLLGIKSAYGLPIIYENKLYGVLEFFSTEIEFPPAQFYNNLAFINEEVGAFLKRREHSIKRAHSEELYRTLVELAPDIIYSIDDNGCIKSLNNAFEKLTRLSKDELIGKPFLEIVHPDDRKEAQEKILSNRKKLYPLPFVARLRTKYDDFVLAEFRNLSKTKLENVEQHPGIIVDVTDRDRLEKQKDIWFGVATHELKTPLTSIKAFTQLLLLKEKGKNRKYLTNINQVTDNMTDLINDLLDLTRINSGTFELQKSPTDISALTAEIIKDMQPAFQYHHIEYHFNKKIIVDIDAKRISQVISNLISNAVKYSPNEKRIIVNIEHADNYVVFSVKDFGIGVVQSELTKIFNIFYRGKSKKASGKPSGLGIGLFVSKTIIKLHNGKIWAESKLSEGSTFYFSLPLR